MTTSHARLSLRAAAIGFIALLAVSCSSNSGEGASSSSSPTTSPSPTSPAAPGTSVAGSVAASSAGAGSSAGGSAAAPAGGVDQASADLVPADLRDKTISIPMIVGNPPMTFADDSGQLVGYNEDLAAATMGVLGLKYEFVKTQFDTIIPGLQSNRYLVTFVSLNPSEERLKIIDMVPFSTTSAVFVTKSDYAGTVNGSKDVCGKKVVAVTASSQYALVEKMTKECTDAGLPAINVTQMPGVSEGTLAIKSGQAELFAMAGTYAAYMTTKDQSVKAQPYKFGSALSGAATGKNSKFADAIASALNVLMHNGEYAKILAKWNVSDIAVDEIKVLR